MGKTADITLATDWVAANQVATLAVLQTAITGLVLGGIDRDHFATGSSPIISSPTAPSSPATGQAWHNSSDGSLSIWNGTAWITSVNISATAPTSTGVPWFDTTAETLRVYVTIDGITGWHGAGSGYQLMTNRSVSTVEVGKVVVRDTTGTTNREFKTTTTVKDQSVIGVMMEETAAGSDGLVAIVGGGATVDILADNGEADGVVAKGDGLVSYSVAGECRTVGLLAGSFIGSGSVTFQDKQGIPMGCFAEALGTKDASTHLVRARLLGSVGTGADIWFDAVEDSITDYSIVGTSTDYDETANLKTAKHGPLVGVHRSWRGAVTTGTGLYDVELFMRRGDDTFAASSDQVLPIQGHVGTGTEIAGALARTFVRTSAGTGSYGSPGNIWVYKRVETARTFSVIQSKLTGYRYVIPFFITALAGFLA